jgi:hypothetical protein
MSHVPTQAELQMIRQALAQQGGKEQEINVAAPMNDIQLQCMMASYLLGSPDNHWRDLPVRVLADEVFEIVAQIIARSADVNSLKFQQRVGQILEQRNGVVADEQPESKPCLVLSGD